MNYSLVRALILLAALIFPAAASRAQAPPPPLLNYQGRVVVGTTNFHGTGQFRFALVTPGGSIVWGNSADTSPADGIPDAAVSLPVTQGLYSVALGDGGVANMAALPYTLLDQNADIRLRVWFDDGANGVQLLSPDQRITAAGYAISALGVNIPTTSFTATGSLAAGVIRQAGVPLIHTGTYAPGDRNFFAGRGAGNFTSQGGSNTGVGTSALSRIGSASSNTAVGAQALSAHTDGHHNTAVGYRALVENGFPGPTSFNTAVGSEALTSNNSGANNTAIGRSALAANVAGSDNTAVGRTALAANNSGVNNTAVGGNALAANVAGSDNTALGFQALLSSTTASGANTAVGSNALRQNTTGLANTAVGTAALDANVDGSQNTALGQDALGGNTSGQNNTALGRDALLGNSSGQSNIAIGRDAGRNLTTGSNNIYIGNPGANAGEMATIRVGSGTSLNPVHTRTFISAIRNVTTGSGNAIGVMIDSNGQLGTVSSSARYKEEIEDLGETSARIQALRPVKFRYSKPFENGEKPVQFGLIAEEVAEAFPELAVYNEAGQPETVKYHDLTPLLLNEVQKLRAEKDELRDRLEKLEAIVNKEAAR